MLLQSLQISLRYFIEVSYHGLAYHGWQIQPNAHTVQAELQSALQQLTGQSIDVVGSGRTDTGVHAKQQFCHLDLQAVKDPAGFLHKLNGILPSDIAVKGIWRVADDAHARFDATKRSYEYVICSQKDPFLKDQSYYLSRLPDYQLMNEACDIMLQVNNFQCFSRVKTGVNNFECELSTAKWVPDNDLLVFYVSANRFLRGMVRAMVGTLLQVGLGKIDMQYFRQVLTSKDRKLAGPSVPPQGLFLTGVQYPKSFLKNI